MQHEARHTKTSSIRYNFYPLRSSQSNPGIKSIYKEQITEWFMKNMLKFTLHMKILLGSHGFCQGGRDHNKVRLFILSVAVSSWEKYLAYMKVNFLSWKCGRWHHFISIILGLECHDACGEASRNALIFQHLLYVKCPETYIHSLEYDWCLIEFCMKIVIIIKECMKEILNLGLKDEALCRGQLWNRTRVVTCSTWVRSVSQEEKTGNHKAWQEGSKVTVWSKVTQLVIGRSESSPCYNKTSEIKPYMHFRQPEVLGRLFWWSFARKPRPCNWVPTTFQVVI